MLQQIDNAVLFGVIFTVGVLTAALVWKAVVWISRQIDALEDKIDEVLSKEDPE